MEKKLGISGCPLASLSSGVGEDSGGANAFHTWVNVLGGENW